MKKKRVVKSKKTYKTYSAKSYALGGSKKQLYGLDYDFILIAGGAFILIVMGIIILSR